MIDIYLAKEIRLENLSNLPAPHKAIDYVESFYQNWLSARFIRSFGIMQCWLR